MKACEVTKLLNITYQALRYYIKKGVLNPIRVREKEYDYDENEVYTLYLKRKNDSRVLSLRKTNKKKRKLKEQSEKRKKNKKTKKSKKSLYKIVLLSNNKMVENMGQYVTIEEARQAWYDMLKENENIKFPIKTLNLNELTEAKYEILLIKRKEDGDSDTTQIRNEYGEFTEHRIIDNDNYIPIDKAYYEKEETFWVFGYHPLRQRKDFEFIYENIIKPKASNSNQFLNVMLFKNKLILDGFDSTDMIICKNKSDNIRLYNKIEEVCKKNKLKYVIFTGDWCSSKKRFYECVEKIMNLTGWDITKIKRYKTGS